MFAKDSPRAHITFSIDVEPSVDTVPVDVLPVEILPSLSAQPVREHAASASAMSTHDILPVFIYRLPFRNIVYHLPALLLYHAECKV